MYKSTSPTTAFGKGIFSFATSKTLRITLVALIIAPGFLFAQVKRSVSPTGSAIKYAKGLKILNKGSFKVVNILNYFNNQTDTLQYLLLGRNAVRPKGYPNAQIIRTPVRSFIGMSSMHIAMAEFVGAGNQIIGQGSLKYVSSPLVRKNIAAGKVKEVGLDGSLNKELIISMHPDVLMVMGNPSAKFSRYETLINAGVPVLTINEWLESSPLARMEWVKLLAALTNREAEVNKKFETIEKQYLSLTRIASRAKSKPVIITGMPFKGTWFVPDADSYNTQLFKDAGASYKWVNEKSTGSLPLSFEAVAPVALKADYWINIGYVNSKKEVLEKDERYAAFKPVKSGKLYNFNKRVNDLGSNDFWESGGVNPHRILADLIKILHPELLPNYKLFYYKQLL